MEDITFVICDKYFVIFGDAIRHLCGGSDDTYFGLVIMDISVWVIIINSMSCSCSCHDSNDYFWCMMKHIYTVIVISAVTLGMSVLFAMYDFYLKEALSVENEDCQWTVNMPLCYLYHAEEFIK
jgi:hypothetical protein